MSGVLATAGGAVFGDDVERYYTAFDSESGEQLWQVRLPSSSGPVVWIFELPER